MILDLEKDCQRITESRLRIRLPDVEEIDCGTVEAWDIQYRNFGPAVLSLSVPFLEIREGRP
jgi:hypothetical protein